MNPVVIPQKKSFQSGNLCPHFGVCGGCDSQDKNYAEQLKAKEDRLKELFFGVKFREMLPIAPSPEIFYYRNKMEYAVGDGAGSLLIGLRQKKRFYKIVDLKECRIFFEDVENIFAIFRRWIKDFNIEPYHLRRHSGRIRYVAMRHSKYYDELMVIVVLASEESSMEPLINGLKDIDKIKSLYLCINDKLADVSVTDDLRLLYGQECIKERINKIDYLISPNSFFQTNPYCCNELYGVIKREAEEIGGQALDICCGSGGITLQVAGDFDKVIGVDISERNIEDALKNAGLNGIRNAEFVCEDAEKFILRLSESKMIKEFSTIIIDPPRAGLSKKTKFAISESRVKNIIYVSCNPANLAEDLKSLSDSYDVDKIIPIDMFPHTRHVEVVAILRSNKV